MSLEYRTFLLTGADIGAQLTQLSAEGDYRLHTILGADEKGTMVLMEREKPLVERPNGSDIDLITGRPKRPLMQRHRG